MQNLYDRAPLRDALAAERTVLAAERTFLAYIRTGFALLLAGVTATQLVESPALRVAAWAVSSAGVAVFALGIWRFLRSYRTTRRLLARIPEE